MAEAGQPVVQAEMELPLTFADYGLISCQDACAGQHRSQAKASGLFLDTCHSPDHLSFVCPYSLNDEAQQLQSFLTSSTPYASDNSSLHSSHGSTDSYSPCTPRPHLHTPAASCLSGPRLEYDELQFMPLPNLNDPVVSLEPIPSPSPSMSFAMQDLRLLQPTSARLLPKSMLQHPDVVGHLRDFSSCFASGATEHQVAQVLESQASGSPRQSWNSCTPSCHSTNTQGARGSPKATTEASVMGNLYTRMLRQPAFAPNSLHPQHPPHPSPATLGLGPPGSQRNFDALLAARKGQPAGYDSPRAISHPVADSLALSNSPRPGQNSPRGIFDSPRVTLSSPLGSSSRASFEIHNPSPARGHLAQPQLDALAHMGPHVSLTRNLPAPQAQPGLSLSRPVRRRAAARQVTYSEQLDLGLDTDSDSDSGLSKVRSSKAKQASPQRPRRQNSKPARFCGDSDSDAGSDQDGYPRRKHHNPWSMEETWTLVQGVEECGGGKWADIKRRNFKPIEKRTAVDLKDKWRNLLRVAVVSPAAMRGKADKRRELPAELLQKVRTLHSLKIKGQANATADLGNRASSRIRRTHGA